MNKTLKRITRIGIFSAMALIMFFLEAMLPPLLVFAPGAKMGLSNVVVLLAVVLLGYLDAAAVVFVKCFIGSVFTNFSSIMYSLPAGFASLAVMVLLYHCFAGRISIMSISFVGAAVHNTAQCLIAAAVQNQIGLLAMLPLMLGASVIAGLFVGITVYFVVKHLPKSAYA